MRNPVTIYMADLVHNMLPGNYVVPLNIASVSAYTKNIFGKDIEISLFKSPSHLMDSIMKRPPHILGLSNYLWNRHLNSQIGRNIKQNCPDITIVMGGPGIQTDEEGIRQFLAQNSYIDIYTLFEGEQPFANFIIKIIGSCSLGDNMFEKKCFANGEIVGGCAYLIEGYLIYSEHNIVPNLDILPSPYLTGWLDKFVDNQFVPLFESNRGCPYSCSYCNWGCSALGKLRPFPLSRICDEMEYVVRKNHNIPYWILADANFGILKRDIEIARKIQEIKKRTRSLGKVLTWASKNNSEVNKRIYKILNEELTGDIERQVIAVQTFDEKVQKAIFRSNIRQNEIPATVKELHGEGIEVTTNILCGLPLETSESHLETLRKCFDIDFDYIVINNIILLPGSKMESGSSRKQYGIKTKFRTRKGSFGNYHGIRAIECEEVVVGTSTMTEEEMLKFRIIHSLIYFCWNTNLLKPLLRYLKAYHQINPVELIISLIEQKKSMYPRLEEVFRQYALDAENERFDSAKEIFDRVYKETAFEKLSEFSFPKLNYKFTATFILDRLLYMDFCNFIFDAAEGLTGKKIPDGLLTLIKESLLDVVKFMNNEAVSEKEIRIERELCEFLMNGRSKNNGPCYVIHLLLPEENVRILRSILNKFEFRKHRQMAIEKTLELFYQIYAYQLRRA